MGSIRSEKKNVKNCFFLSSSRGLGQRNCLLKDPRADREAEVCIDACMFLFDFDHQQIFDAATPNTSHASNNKEL